MAIFRECFKSVWRNFPFPVFFEGKGLPAPKLDHCGRKEEKEEEEEEEEVVEEEEEAI